MFGFLAQKFSSIFSRLSQKKQLDAQTIQNFFEEMQETLLSADVPFDVVQTFVAMLNDDALLQKRISSLNPSEQLLKMVYEKMVAFLGGEQKNEWVLPSSAIVMVIGLQGSGKTTTVGKLAAYLKKKAHKKKERSRILVGSVDYYRPAAIDQLEIVAQKAGVDFYRAISNNPVQAAKEIQNYAKEHRYDVVLLDTAGRLHVDAEMLEELYIIKNQIQPKYTMLVLDAMTGQESFAVARSFDKKIGFQGAILSKSDSDARGGAAFSFRYALKKPIVFVGVGEKVEDLDQFHAERVASGILGMGDIQSLVERANEKIKEHEQQSIYNTWEKGSFTLHDFAQQLDMISRIGSFSSIMKYMPQIGGMKVSQEALEQGQQEMKIFRAIIGSMTFKERVYPRILNDSRKQRIAQGAGVTRAEVEKLLARFVNMQQYAKLIKKSGGIRNVFK